MKNFFKGLVCGIVICLISYTVMVYYGNIQEKDTIKKLKEEQKINEQRLIDSLRSVPIDTLAFRLELRARQRLH